MRESSELAPTGYSIEDSSYPFGSFQCIGVAGFRILAVFDE